MNLSKEIEGMYFAREEDDLCDNCQFSRETKSTDPFDRPEQYCANKKHFQATEQFEFQLTNGEALTLFTCPGFEEA